MPVGSSGPEVGRGGAPGSRRGPRGGALLRQGRGRGGGASVGASSPARHLGASVGQGRLFISRHALAIRRALT